MSAETKTMTHWFVASPSYPYHEVVLDDGTGPTYDISDFTEVDAPTRRDAITTAVKEWLAERGDNYVQQRRSDGLSPFAGVKAVSVAELKAETFESGPPEWAADFCDTCTPAHVGDALRWVWKDEGDEPGDDWGWFGTCATAAGSGE